VSTHFFFFNILFLLGTASYFISLFLSFFFFFSCVRHRMRPNPHPHTMRSGYCHRQQLPIRCPCGGILSRFPFLTFFFPSCPIDPRCQAQESNFYPHVFFRVCLCPSVPFASCWSSPLLRRRRGQGSFLVFSISLRRVIRLDVFCFRGLSSGLDLFWRVVVGCSSTFFSP